MDGWRLSRRTARAILWEVTLISLVLVLCTFVVALLHLSVQKLSVHAQVAGILRKRKSLPRTRSPSLSLVLSFFGLVGMGSIQAPPWECRTVALPLWLLMS